jgi:quercetin dioxygenase-like cupin family protein
MIPARTAAALSPSSPEPIRNRRLLSNLSPRTGQRHATFRPPQPESPPMTTEGFVVSHAEGAAFERGLRSFYEYRDLGIKNATAGRVEAHVIRAAAGQAFLSQAHIHKTEFQLVYILKGWIEFEYEGQGIVRLEAGSCVHQPPGIRHRELGHSADIEMLEVVLPAGFATEEVATVNG